MGDFECVKGLTFNITFVFSVIDPPRKVIPVMVFIFALTNLFIFKKVKNISMDPWINRHFN